VCRSFKLTQSYPSLTLLLNSCFAGAGFVLRFTRKDSAFPSAGNDGRTCRHVSQVDCRIYVPIMQCAAGRTAPLAHLQAEHIEPMAAA